MDRCFQTLKEKWARANMRRIGSPFGLFVDGSDTLTNLRFADDVVMFATSRGDMRKMLAHLLEESAKFGLKMHMGKTK
eukprot:5608375-Karenia_brevis.AAC.1